MFIPLIKGIKKINPAFLIAIALFILPFFWYPPGAMDLGGDGTRLYFYDPTSFIKNVALYSTAPEGKANIDPAKHAYLTYVGFLAFIKYFVNSPSLLISIFNGIKLSIGFLSVYFIVKELIQEDEKKSKLSIELSALIAGGFYIIATGSEKVIFFWVKALHSHDQVFLNPLIFLFLLRFLLTRNKVYLFSIVLITLLFSVDFAMISSPSFFAFYPLALLFLLLYIVFVRKRKIFIKDIVLGLLFFLGMHAYHILPEISSLFDKSSIIHSVIFKETVSGGVNFFDALRGEGKASFNLLLSSPLPIFRWTSIIAPLVIIVAFLLQKKKKSVIILTCFFFLLTLYLVSVNLTNIGFELYKLLFYIPGFSMFRHFFIQWAFIFFFFYALLLGQSLAIIFEKIKPKYTKTMAASILLIFILSSWNFLNGHLVDAVQWGSRDVKTAMIMDPRYEQVLEFIRKLPDEGKILILPLTDNFNQVIFGKNNAAYVGPSSISFLTSKKSFAGYQNFDSYPYTISEDILKFSREKNYERLTQIFSLFNIRYIFHNTDPKIYEEKFPEFPNSYMMASLPKTQEEYKKFVKEFPVSIIYENGPYQIFEFDKNVYRPEVYIPDTLYIDDMLVVLDNKEVSYQSGFIDKETCRKNQTISDFCNSTYQSPYAEITVTKNNPNDYMISITQTQSELPILVVFQNAYNPSWKLSLANEPPIHEGQHLLVNRYANAWLITKEDRQGKTTYVLHLVLQTQKYFSYGIGITFVTLLIIFAFVIREFVKKKNK